MSSFTNLSILDSVPTARLFAVSNIDYTTGVAAWTYAAGGSYDASVLLSMSVKPPSAKSSRTRIRARVSIPIMDPVFTTKKIDELIGEVSFSIPKTSTLLQRKDLRAYVGNLFGATILQVAIDSNEGIY